MTNLFVGCPWLKPGLKYSYPLRVGGTSIQALESETSASTDEYSKSNHASKYVMLLSNCGEENHGLSPVSEAGFRHRLVLVSPIVTLIHIIRDRRVTQDALYLQSAHLSAGKCQAWHVISWKSTNDPGLGQKDNDKRLADWFIVYASCLKKLHFSIAHES